MNTPPMSEISHKVVVVGGGFAGLNAAKVLAGVPCLVTVLDRQNHHVFQPLLYQVATASLSPAQIAAPIRRVLNRAPNIDVHMAEVLSINPAARTVHTSRGDFLYDTLILAAGATHSYFGHDEWASLAPGLKTIDDAIEIRRRFLVAFERADLLDDSVARSAALTFVVVGAGPTGVELAGAMAEIAGHSVPRDFRSLRDIKARILLVEGHPRVLPTMPEDLSERARRDLVEMGVEVITGAHVTAIDARGVQIGDRRVDAETVFWAAGVRASTLAQGLGVPLDKSGRVVINDDLTVPGRPEIIVVGDLASIVDRRSGRPVPGLAPAAMQMGRYAGRLVRARVLGKPLPGPFAYVNKGELATIGRARAVGVLGFGLGMKMTGLFAWAFWALIHVTYLIGFRSKLMVMIDWVWSYISFERGARLITGHDVKRP